jgi:hypothetical protein
VVKDGDVWPILLLSWLAKRVSRVTKSTRKGFGAVGRLFWSRAALQSRNPFPSASTEGFAPRVVEARGPQRYDRLVGVELHRLAPELPDALRIVQLESVIR